MLANQAALVPSSCIIPVNRCRGACCLSNLLAESQSILVAVPYRKQEVSEATKFDGLVVAYRNYPPTA